MKCQFCGKELVDNAIFCNYCGKKIETGSDSDNTQNNNYGNVEYKVYNTFSDRSFLNKKKSKIKWRYVIYTLFALIAAHSISKYASKRNQPKTIQEIIEHNQMSEEEIHEEIKKSILEYNKRLPMKTDNITTLLRAEVIGNRIIYTGEVEGVQPIDFKEEMIEYTKKEACKKIKINDDFIQFMKDYDYEIMYKYVNEYNEPLFNIIITPYDL